MTNELTDRQKSALDETVQELRRDHGSSIGSRWGFDIVYREETRPGRGHDILYVYGDSENIVIGNMDPYGSGTFAVGEVEWVHNGADEDCACSPCRRDADEYVPPAARPVVDIELPDFEEKTHDQSST